RAFVQVRVPERDPALRQLARREQAQRVEGGREVAKVVGRARQGRARVGQQRAGGEERQQGGAGGAPGPLAHGSRRSRTARAGTPATSVCGGTSAVTTLPAATNDSAPMV